MIKLSGNFISTLENNNGKARLIAYKDGVENVCRRESLKTPERFILSDQSTIFECRLQLRNNKDGIAVEVKGKVGG
jgi:hypothetical protein